MNSAPNLDKLSLIRVLAVGDIMLDRYNYNRVERISSTAPVPICRPGKEHNVLGGARNIVANLISFGSDVDIISRTGLDKDGKIVADMISAIGATIGAGFDIPTSMQIANAA